MKRQNEITRAVFRKQMIFFFGLMFVPNVCMCICVYVCGGEGVGGGGVVYGCVCVYVFVSVCQGGQYHLFT